VELPGAARDTAETIERRVIEGLAPLSPEERLTRTMALCRAAGELAMAGIRLREGDWTWRTLRQWASPPSMGVAPRSVRPPGAGAGGSEDRL